MELMHGGDWAGYEARYGRPPLDFSANVSPLGLPEGVRRGIIAALSEAHRYPDPLCRTLRQRLGEREGLPPEQILCGNGAADLIFRGVLAVSPRRALITAPTFGEYEQALTLADCQVERFFLREEEGFVLTSRLLEAITPGVEMVFLCEPNNPTGAVSDWQLLLEVLERCRRTGALLVVDECFGDFLEDQEAHTLRGQVGDFPNLLILKAFTKMYAMAGVRLGYCLCGDTVLLEKMAGAGQPWGVSSLAQAAGLAALQETEYVSQVRQLITRQRPVLQKGLEELGCTVWPGAANYLLFKVHRPGLTEALEQRGITLRSCKNYHGLGPDYYRTAVRTEEENQRLLAALREVL